MPLVWEGEGVWQQGPFGQRWAADGVLFVDLRIGPLILTSAGSAGHGPFNQRENLVQRTWGGSSLWSNHPE
jgi:hypothetical protein